MPLKPNGRVYTINGKKMVLFPIAKLVEEMEKAGYPRDSQTIRKWETAGVTPPALFRSGQKRLYSMEQIKVFCEVAKECDIKQGFSIAMTDFSARIWERMKEVNKELQNK